MFGLDMLVHGTHGDQLPEDELPEEELDVYGRGFTWWAGTKFSEGK